MRQISLEEVESFRKSTSAQLWTKPDVWDLSASHYGLFIGEALIATLRRNESISRRLPIHEYMPDLVIGHDDVQFGRLLVADEHRRGKALISLLTEVRGMLKQERGSPYITPLDFSDGGLNEKNFLRLGFSRLPLGVELQGGRTLPPMVREPSVSTA